jgi:F0F1-type ATP synthase assembly protein I
MAENNSQNPGSSNSSPKPEGNPGKNLMGLGVQIVAQVVVGILVGLWLDKHFENKNSLFTIILATLMIVVALYQFIRQALKN